MSDRVFLDTNVILYAYDRGAPPSKRDRGRELMREAIRDELSVISPQVLGEFFVTATGKFQEPLSADAALRVVRHLTRLDVVEMDGSLSVRAVQMHQRYQVSYWDGLILAAAERGRCDQVLSEDLSNRQVYAGVQVVDPFSS
jgi:predicted nucleic acid-binding protein